MNIKKIILWIFIVGTSSVILYFGNIFYQLFFNMPACGYNDGPFYGRNIELSTDSPKFDFTVSTELGDYGIINRTDDESPILVRMTKGKITWAKELDVRLEPAFSSTFFWKAENLHYEPKNQKLMFQAHWTYGAEQGMIFLDETGEVKKMCLSW